MRTRHKGSTPLAQKAREAKQNPQKIPEENLGKIPKQLSHQPTLPASEQLDMIRDNDDEYTIKNDDEKKTFGVRSSRNNNEVILRPNWKN